MKIDTFQREEEVVEVHGVTLDLLTLKKGGSHRDRRDRGEGRIDSPPGTEVTGTAFGDVVEFFHFRDFGLRGGLQ